MSYNSLSEERKAGQKNGTIPEWFTTAGFQMFKAKYLWAKDIKSQYKAIAGAAAKHVDGLVKTPRGYNAWSDAFFDVLWRGWVSPSTPVLSNMGTNRGMPVSCSGQYVGDSISEIYMARHEAAILTKNGFGTSALLDIRPRGAIISKGGTASGVVPVMQNFVKDMQYVSQGNQRRGSIGQYLDINCGDFEEVVKLLENTPDDLNVGWNISDDFINACRNGNPEAIKRFQKALKTKMVTGKGYFCFIDKMNRLAPDCYKRLGLKIKQSNLCSEIALFNDLLHTFTCVLSSMNLAKYDEWCDTDAVFIATVFLDCVVSEFLSLARCIFGLENAVRFTEKGRALGLGACGFHTYLQTHNIPFTYEAAKDINNQMFSHIQEQATKASRYLAEALGEPEWCKGTGMRNTHLMAIAPTKSTALIMGGISEGINPDPAMIYTQTTAAGEVERINPTLLKLMKSLGLDDHSYQQEIIDARGSVQDVTWLLPSEKEVFKTAFEIYWKDHLMLCSDRQKFIDQAQSINLSFKGTDREEEIAKAHVYAMLDPYIKSLYYVYSSREVKASTGAVVCESCQ